MSFFPNSAYRTIIEGVPTAIDSTDADTILAFLATAQPKHWAGGTMLDSGGVATLTTPTATGLPFKDKSENGCPRGRWFVGGDDFDFAFRIGNNGLGTDSNRAVLLGINNSSSDASEHNRTWSIGLSWAYYQTTRGYIATQTDTPQVASFSNRVLRYYTDPTWMRIKRVDGVANIYTSYEVDPPLDGTVADEADTADWNRRWFANITGGYDIFWDWSVVDLAMGWHGDAALEWQVFAVKADFVNYSGICGN